MLLFTTREKFDLQSIQGQKSSQIVFRNKVLTRGPDFARKLWKSAKKYCETYYNSDSLCLLVEHASYVSVWKEYDDISGSKDPSKQNEPGKTQSKSEAIATETESKDRPIEIELNQEFASYCQQELAEFIGPIAGVVCTRTLAENPNLEVKKFIAELAKQIPDKDLAKEFEQRLLASL